MPLRHSGACATSSRPGSASIRARRSLRSRPRSCARTLDSIRPPHPARRERATRTRACSPSRPTTRPTSSAATPRSPRCSIDSTGAHLVAVVGPSGSGKSSLVLAGVVPRLRDRGRAPVLITPGAGRRTGDVVIVDQFEELFQLGWPPGDVSDYCESVAEVVAGGHDVILTAALRRPRPLCGRPPARPARPRRPHRPRPPSADALRLAIEEPARFAGLRVEHGLTELILRDAVGEPGVLPHLSHALAETWQRREGTVLTVEAYESVGGIGGAIARSAEELYSSLTPEERIQCHALLRRLVSLTPEGRTVQHRVAVGPAPRRRAPVRDHRAAPRTRDW